MADFDRDKNFSKALPNCKFSNRACKFPYRSQKLTIFFVLFLPRTRSPRRPCACPGPTKTWRRWRKRSRTPRSVPSSTGVQCQLDNDSLLVNLDCGQELGHICKKNLQIASNLCYREAKYSSEVSESAYLSWKKYIQINQCVSGSFLTTVAYFDVSISLQNEKSKSEEVLTKLESDSVSWRSQILFSDLIVLGPLLSWLGNVGDQNQVVRLIFSVLGLVKSTQLISYSPRSRMALTCSFAMSTYLSPDNFIQNV